MIVTCTFQDFKALHLDASSTKYSGAMMYVKGAGGVTHASSMNTARLGIVFVLSNTPTQNNFLEEFPDAVKVDSIS